MVLNDTDLAGMEETFICIWANSDSEIWNVCGLLHEVQSCLSLCVTFMTSTTVWIGWIRSDGAKANMKTVISLTQIKVKCEDIPSLSDRRARWASGKRSNLVKDHFPRGLQCYQRHSLPSSSVSLFVNFFLSNYLQNKNHARLSSLYGKLPGPIS